MVEADAIAENASEPEISCAVNSACQSIPALETPRPLSPTISSVDERLWTEQQTADYLQVAVGTLRRWRAEGTGPPALRAGRTVRYRKADVDAWLQRERERDSE
jgi:excisionase family DNA binding protein